MNITHEFELQIPLLTKQLFCAQHHGGPFRKSERSIFKGLMEGIGLEHYTSQGLNTDLRTANWAAKARRILNKKGTGNVFWRRSHLRRALKKIGIASLVAQRLKCLPAIRETWV